MNRQGLLVVISGFAGSGKGTLMNCLLHQFQNYALSVSATTRAPRPSEVHGKEYFFITTSEFEDMIQKNELIEWARYVNNYYGTPKAYVNEQLICGKDVILEIEVQGALKIKKEFPEALLIYITPPNATILKERLVTRGTEDADLIKKRLARAWEECQFIEQYDYIVVNDQLDECVHTIHSIIHSKHFSTEKHKPFINQLKEELKSFSEGE